MSLALLTPLLGPLLVVPQVLQDEVAYLEERADELLRSCIEDDTAAAGDAPLSLRGATEARPPSTSQSSDSTGYGSAGGPLVSRLGPPTGSPSMGSTSGSTATMIYARRSKLSAAPMALQRRAL